MGVGWEGGRENYIHKKLFQTPVKLHALLILRQKLQIHQFNTLSYFPCKFKHSADGWCGEYSKESNYFPLQIFLPGAGF
jgi:hypothetical protein